MATGNAAQRKTYSGSRPTTSIWQRHETDDLPTVLTAGYYTPRDLPTDSVQSGDRIDVTGPDYAAVLEITGTDGNGNFTTALVASSQSGAAPATGALILLQDLNELAASDLDPAIQMVSVSGRHWRRTPDGPGTATHLSKVTDAGGNFWELDEAIMTSQDAIDPTDNQSVQYAAEAALYWDRPFINSFEGVIYVDFDVEANKFALPGPATTDAGLQPAQEATDIAVFDGAVEPEYRFGAAQDQYALYREDIQRFNAFRKAIRWYQKCIHTSTGTFQLRFEDCACRLFGEERSLGLNSHLDMRAKSVHRCRVLSVNYAPNPSEKAGPFNYTATIVTDETPPAYVEPGMAFGTAEVRSSTPASDDIHKIMGGGIITALSTTTITDDTISCEVVNARGTGATGAYRGTFSTIAEISTALGGVNSDWAILDSVDGGNQPGAYYWLTGSVLAVPNLVGGSNVINSGTGSILGSAAGEIFIPGFQMLISGGFDARADESLHNFRDGSTLKLFNVGFSDVTDPDITRDNGTLPARKVFFVGALSLVQAVACVFGGGEERTLRVAKSAVFSASTCSFFGRGLDTFCQRAIEAQIASDIDIVNCIMGGYSIFGILASSMSRFSAQNCIISNANILVRATTDAHINLQSTLLLDGNTGINADAMASVIIDAGTELENIEDGLVYTGGARISGTPLFTDVTTISTAPQGSYHNGGIWIAPTSNPLI